MKSNSKFTKFCCAIIGWNPSILSECGEASYRTLRRYMSAIAIISVVWGTIGFLFAERYIGIEALPLKLMVSFVFAGLIICIERFIILKVGKSYATSVMRLVLGLLMAILGATIFDQMIFKNDLDVKMTQARDIEANELLKIRMVVLDKQIADNQLLIDSVNKEYEKKLSEANAKPYITSVERRQEQVLTGKDSLGNNVYETRSNYNTRQEPNPKFAQAQALATMRDKYIEHGQELNGNMLTLENTIRKEIAEKPRGFLEELKVLFNEIILKDKYACAFYLVLFLFMLSLELLVLSSKLGEKQCDYDLIVEHQLKIKEATLLRMQEELTK